MHWMSTPHNVELQLVAPSVVKSIVARSEVGDVMEKRDKKVGVEEAVELPAREYT